MHRDEMILELHKRQPSLPKYPRKLEYLVLCWLAQKLFHNHVRDRKWHIPRAWFADAKPHAQDALRCNGSHREDSGEAYRQAALQSAISASTKIDERETDRYDQQS